MQNETRSDDGNDAENQSPTLAVTFYHTRAKEPHSYTARIAEISGGNLWLETPRGEISISMEYVSALAIVAKDE